MKISKHDKDSLIIAAAVIGVVTLSVIFCIGTKYIPLFWLGIGVAAFEVFYCMPVIYKKYYKVNGYEAGISAYIPGLNVLQVFSSKFAIAFLINVIAILILGIATFLPISVYEPILDSHTAMNVAPTLYPLTVFAIIVLNFVLGAGYLSVFMTVRQMLCKLYNSRSYRSDSFSIILLFVPLFRVCGLLAINSCLSRLLLNGYVDSDFVEEESVKEVV